MRAFAPAETTSLGGALDGAVALGDERMRDVLPFQRHSRSVRRGWLLRRALAGADILGLSLAFVVASQVFGSAGEGDRVSPGFEFLVFFLMLPGWVILAKLHGLYDRDETEADHSTVEDVFDVVQFVTLGTWLFLLGTWVTGLADPVPAKLAGFWALAIVLVVAGRAMARASCRRRSVYLQNTLIVGAGDIGQLIARKLTKHPEYGINLVGFVDDCPKDRRGDVGDAAVVGGPAQLPELIESLDVERIVVSFSNASTEETLKLIRSVRHLDVQIDLVPRLFEVVGPKASVHTVEGLPLVGLPPARLSRSSRAIKRAIDIAGASALLLVTAPLLALIALRVKWDSPGPALFRQTRLGQDMRAFTLLKFRTMKVDTDESQHREYVRNTMSSTAEAPVGGAYKLDRTDAVTRVGRWLRRSSLDELPQLINVLKGDLSLVGPRPCIPYEVDNFKPHQFERFLVPQGLTGLWQVTARANATFGEALEMDVAYARGWSLGLDLRLLCRTPFALLRQRTATS
jgi:exopolysaccharide biosynthesis polyprenyl glycosylphosphotransferase